jgi:hypothetical protein
LKEFGRKMKITDLITKNKFLAYLVLPLILFFTGLSFFHEMALYYLRSIDPEYAYLFNGLTIARLRFELGHIDHPGTPLQILIAISIWIIQPFRSQNSMAENVISNPELYLRTTFYLILVFNSIALYYLGKTAGKIRGVWAGILLQLTPFSAIIYLGGIVRVRPETLQFGFFAFLIILCIMYAEKFKFALKEKQYILRFALMVAFALSLKISSISLAIIPLLIIHGRTQKFRYLGLVLLFFFLISFPVLIRYQRFIQWTSNLVTHSGQYGHGEANIIDLGSILPNFKSLFKRNEFLYIIQLIILTFIVFNRLLKKYTENDQCYIKLLTGTVLAVLVQTLLTLKHFGQHYMIPINMVYVFQIWIVLIILSSVKIIGNQRQLLYLFAFILLAFKNTSQIIPVYRNAVKSGASPMKSVAVVNNMRTDGTYFILPNLYGSPLPQVALNFGCIWSGRYRKEYKKLLQKKYPSTYIYSTWTNSFLFWTDSIDFSKEMRKYTHTLLYLGKDNQSSRTLAKEKIGRFFITDSLVFENYYLNVEKNEAFYKLKAVKP